MRLTLFWFAVLSMLTVATAMAAETPVLRVAYAGSMGAVMDRALGPAFAKVQHVQYQGIGQGSYALAHLVASKQLRVDVFVAITPGPIRVLQMAGLVDHAVPVASTRMVVVYSPGSRFAADFKALINFIMGISSPKTASRPPSSGSSKNLKWVIFFLAST